MKRDENRVPPINDPDVVRAGIDYPYDGEAMRGGKTTKGRASRLFRAAGKHTATLRMGSGWPSFTEEKMPGSKGDRDNATPSSTDAMQDE